MDDRNLYSFLYFFDDLVDHWHYSFYNFFDFLNSVHIHDLLLDNFHLLDGWNFHSHLNDLFDDLWNLLDAFYDLDDRDYFLYYSFDDLRDLLNVVDHFTSSLVLHCIH